jgi:class 3 adenylate cyclase/tetratricopeptide (TPR) repeat protein
MPACAQCGAAVPTGARFCPACAAPVEHVPDPAEERKIATVLFADLVGSTALAGSEDPERTRATLNRFYEAMAAEIEHAGGTVEKFVGDAVMAAFGAPVALEDHAERALHAGLAMRQRLHDLFGDRLALRIGINTGEVVVGRAREGSSFVTGDAVNVGARLEQAAGAGEILVGERTAAAVRGAFELDDPVIVEAKGKAGGVSARRLVRALSLMRPRGVGGLHSAFVGRDGELNDLRSTYDQVVTRREPRLVVIAGDPGVGKTRIVRELWSWLAEQRSQPLQRTGRCLSYGNATAYWPLAELLREHFGILDADPPEVAAGRLGARRYLGLTLGLETGEQLHPLVARERLHDAWAEFLSELAGERPAVVLIEDVHWAEDDLLDLLDALISQVDGPLLVLATARPELLDRRPVWSGAGRNRSCVVLDALPPADASELLTLLLGSDPPSSVREAVVERSEGNPFFVEELLSTLIDRGVLTRQNGGWLCSELPDGFAIPDTVQAVLAARIDLLPEAEKAALQAGAVIGRVFWTGPIYELLDGATPDFGLLEERDFVRRRLGSTITGEREYAIKHALTREVAYASLPKARRAQLHAAFAGWLERITNGGDEQADLLAHHYAEAVRPEDADLAWTGREHEADRLRAKACEWCRLAARLAISRYEIDTGIALMHQAIELDPDRGGQAELWYEIGLANALKYDGQAFTRAMRRALELGAPEAAVFTELVYQGVQRGAMWNPPIDDELDAWVERALATSAPGSLERGKALVAHAGRKSRPDSAREAIALAEVWGDDDLRAAALFTLVDACYWSGDLDGGMEAVEQALTLLPRISDPDRRANIYVQAGSFPGALGRFDESLRAADLLTETVARLTPHHRVHAVGLSVGIAGDMGRWAHICELTPRAEATIDANLDTPCLLNQSSLLYCALAHEWAGDHVEARRLESKAEGFGLKYDDAFDTVRIQLALARGDVDRVRTFVDRLYDESSHDHWVHVAVLNGLLGLGDHARIQKLAPACLKPGTYLEPFALRALGVARKNEEMIERAAARFDGMGLDWHADQTRKLID